MPNTIIPYNPKLKQLARELRKNATVTEMVVWKHVRGKAFGVEFHRQVPMLEYIVDFYCHELKLVIEVDGITHDFDGVSEQDAMRQKSIEEYGVSFLRFSSREVIENISSVILSIEFMVERLQREQTSP
jgi:very-short-patch-repair endonuclease